MQPPQVELSDEELLRRYGASRDQRDDAFSQLVRRHVDFVYASAKRQVGDATLAEDVTQAVFVILAGKHATVPSGKLAGWLFNTARLAARNAIKMQIRRRKYEQRAAAERSEITAPQVDQWEEISPQLDDAVARLGQGERDVVLMHFFQAKPLDEVGQLLGISEAAARKRSSRAIEKLREILSRRGVETTAASLTAGLVRHAIVAAPAHLTASTAITTGSAAFTASSAALRLASAATRASAIMQLKIAAAITAAIAMGGTAAVVAHHHYAAAPIVIPNTASAPVAIVPPALPASAVQYKTVHATVDAGNPAVPRAEHIEVFLESGKRFLFVKDEAGPATALYGDSQKTLRYQIGGDVAVTQSFMDPALQTRETRMIKDASNWPRDKAVRDPASDMVIKGASSRAFKITNLALAGGLPATLWVDAADRPLHMSAWRGTNVMLADFQWDGPAETLIPAKYLPAGLAAMNANDLIDKLVPAKSPLLIKAAGQAVTIRSTTRDEAGAYHIIVSVRSSDSFATTKAALANAVSAKGDSSPRPPISMSVQPTTAGDRVIWLATETLGDVAVCECIVIPKVSGGDCKFAVNVQSSAPGRTAPAAKKITISLPAPRDTVALADALAATHDRAVALYGLSDVTLASNAPTDIPISTPSPFAADKIKWIADVTKRMGLDVEPGL